MSDTLVLHTTYQQPCCAALRGSQPSQPVICLHMELPARSSLHQLHSIPGMALFPDMRLVVIIKSFKKKTKKTTERESREHCVHVYVWRGGGNWLSAQHRGTADKSTFLNLTDGRLNRRLEAPGVTSTRRPNTELIRQSACSQFIVRGQKGKSS